MAVLRKRIADKKEEASLKALLSFIEAREAWEKGRTTNTRPYAPENQPADFNISYGEEFEAMILLLQPLVKQYIPDMRIDELQICRHDWVNRQCSKNKIKLILGKVEETTTC